MLQDQTVRDLRKRPGRISIIALFMVGLMLLSRGMTTASDETDLAEVRQVAEQGSAEAQFNFGEMSYQGKIVPRNYTSAATWFQKAAEQGHAEAQNALGAMYASGQGVSKDYRQAATWYEKAAVQGIVAAQTNLGYLYANADGDLKNEVKAYAWYSVAANQGYENAIKGRDLVAAHLSSEERIQAIIYAAELQARINTRQTP